MHFWKTFRRRPAGYGGHAGPMFGKVGASFFQSLELSATILPMVGTSAHSAPFAVRIALCRRFAPASAFSGRGQSSSDVWNPAVIARSYNFRMLGKPAAVL